MNINKYLTKKGYDTIDSSFYRQIDIWHSWYVSNVRRFHRYRVFRGTGGYVWCKRRSLGMGKKVCEDIADLLLNEKVKITISDEATGRFVSDVLESNNFSLLGNEYQERKAYCGTVAYVPYIKNFQINTDGYPSGGGSIRINYVTAENIFPLSWENGIINEVAFVFWTTCKNVKYARLEFHRLNPDGTYFIENTILRVNKSSVEEEIPSSEWSKIRPFKDLAPRVETGSPVPQFVIDKLNIVNNVDEDKSNPMGIALFSNAIDILQSIDIKYDSYSNEFDLGRKRIFVAPEMLTAENGNPIFDPDDSVFYQLPEDYSRQFDKEPIKESNMDLRVDEHSKAINDELNYLSFRLGFGTNRYRFDKGSLTTATQVISENSDMFRTLKKHEIVLDAVLKNLVRIIIRLGNVIGNNLKEDCDITIDFDDSIIEDTDAERTSDRQEVAMGVMSREEYRAKWYGETIEQAKGKLPEQTSEVIM